MKDLIGFVLRGALPGVTLSIVLAILSYGWMGATLGVSPIFFAYAMLPGAIAGLVLWFITGRADKPLTAGRRFSIGTAIVAAYSLVVGVAQVALSLGTTRLQYVLIPWTIMWIAVWAVSIGGLGGLACPASREYRVEPKLTYWERTQLYEAAEQEAKAARERNVSSRVITNPPGLMARRNIAASNCW
jgi:hypothetical protein